MKRVFSVFLAVSFFYGCATEWRADRPVAPITYRVPAYRAERSIGNLRRLVVLPVRIRRVRQIFGVTESERTDATSTYLAADYLSEHKGYQAVPVIDRSGAWRPEAVVKGEFGSIDVIKTTWEQARSEEEIANAVKKIGRALEVDGVVSIWLEEIDESFSAINAVEAIITVFPLFLTPLFYAMLHVGAEAVIYEALSGEGIWRNQFTAGSANLHLKTGSIVYKFFENLENAIPPQLTN